MRRALAASFTMLCLTSCATGGNFFDGVDSAPLSTQPLDPTLTFYHAYGDSITAGYALPSAQSAFPELLSQYNHLPLTNYALAGDQACHLASVQIFPAQDSPTVARKGLYTVLIGTNDAYSAGAHEIPFNLCHQAALSWLAVPLENKTLAVAATLSGKTHVDTSSNWNAVVTDAAGSAITFSLQHAAAGPVYVWYRLISGNPGAFTYAIDGVRAGSGTTAPASDALGDQSYPNSLALLRLPSVAAGTHTIVFTQVSSAASGMGIVALGTPFTGDPTLRPRVLAGLLPLQYNTGRQAGIAAFDADIQANVALLASDGLDVELFDAAHYMTGTPADLLDALHPNNVGHREIFKAVEDTLR